MEVAVGDVADDRRGERQRGGDVRVRLLDAVGEARHRHAHVGGQRRQPGR